MNRIEKEKRNRRNSIIKAAKKLFLRDGYENVSMDDIAVEAQFTRRTLYAYFTSKEELYLLVFMKISKHRWRIIDDAVDKETTTFSKLRAYAESSFEYAMQYPSHVRLGLYWEHNGLDISKIRPDISAQYERPFKKAYNHLYTVIENGIKEGSINTELDASHLMRYLCLSLRTMVNEIILGYEKKEFYFQYLDFFLSALKK